MDTIDLLEKYGLTYTTEFVPLSHSRNAGKWDSINWRVTFTRGRQSLTTDYSQGVGYLPASCRIKFPSGKTDAYRTREAERLACEHGTIPSVFAGSVHKGMRRLSPPPVHDVLYSLSSEAGVLDFACYEDWASEHGYDPDSRKGEATYRACLDIALKLRAMLGDAKLAELREDCQRIDDGEVAAA